MVAFIVEEVWVVVSLRESLNRVPSSLIPVNDLKVRPVHPSGGAGTSTIVVELAVVQCV